MSPHMRMGEVFVHSGVHIYPLLYYWKVSAQWDIRNFDFHTNGELANLGAHQDLEMCQDPAHERYRNCIDIVHEL